MLRHRAVEYQVRLDTICVIRPRERRRLKRCNVTNFSLSNSGGCSPDYPQSFQRQNRGPGRENSDLCRPRQVSIVLVVIKINGWPFVLAMPDVFSP